MLKGAGVGADPQFSCVLHARRSGMTQSRGRAKEARERNPLRFWIYIALPQRVPHAHLLDCPSARTMLTCRRTVPSAKKSGLRVSTTIRSKYVRQGRGCASSCGDSTGQVSLAWAMLWVCKAFIWILQGGWPQASPSLCSWEDSVTILQPLQQQPHKVGQFSSAKVKFLG